MPGIVLGGMFGDACVEGVAIIRRFDANGDWFPFVKVESD
jgi:hypothetical protein